MKPVTYYSWKSKDDYSYTRPRFSLSKTREMENLRRGPNCGDFVTILTEGPMQDNTVARLQSTGVQTPLSLLD
jgi:hypothetical protein